MGRVKSSQADCAESTEGVMRENVMLRDRQRPVRPGRGGGRVLGLTSERWVGSRGTSTVMLRGSDPIL